MDFFTREDSVDKLTLSNRLRNCLNRLEIDTVGKLLDFPRDEWAGVRNMGAKTVSEVLALTEELFSALNSGVQATYDLPEEYRDLCSELEKNLGVPNAEGIAAEIYREHPDASGETLVYWIYENALVKKAMTHKILTDLDGKRQGLTAEELHSKFPAHLNNTTILEECLLDLEFKGKIQEEDGAYVKCYPSAVEFVANISDEKKRGIIQLRLSGKTQDETGAAFGMSKERVRQICNKEFEKAPTFAEDLYKDLYIKYDLDKESLDRIFHEPIQTAMYLEMRYSSRGQKRTPIKEMLEDDTLSSSVKRSVEAYVYRDYLNIDGFRVQKTRPELFRYVVKTYCKDKRTFAETVEIYHKFLDAHGLSGIDNLQMNSRSYENRIAERDCDYALANFHHGLRYYNVSERDYTQLVQEIDLPQYKNIEISSLKIFREQPDLMEQYDIRDEFELHNLLKKIWPRWGNAEVCFGTMPTLRFGTFNTEEQVLDLLLQSAPIKSIEFADLCEEAFGFRSETIRGGLLRCLDPYLSHGEYIIEQEVLPPEQHSRMQEILTDDFYTVADIQRIYKREFPETHHILNTYNIKSLGFYMNSSYVIRSSFQNAAVYFRYLLTNSDVVDASDFPRSLTILQAYQAELTDLRANRVIIEFQPKHYINIRRLESNGIGREDLDDYCSQAEKFIDRDVYFTITSLKLAGFQHPLDDLYFDDWFYSSILAEDHERFSYRRMGGTRLFYSGQHDVTLTDFLESILERENSIELDDLINLMSQQYDLQFSREKLLEVLKDTDLYYDRIMDTVYIDYDTYFEEV